MSRKLATFDRILLGLLGIILIALGVWPILIPVSYTHLTLPTNREV